MSPHPRQAGLAELANSEIGTGRSSTAVIEQNMNLKKIFIHVVTEVYLGTSILEPFLVVRKHDMLR